MASDWNEELDKYESGRSFGDDLKDSIRAARSVTCLIASKNSHAASGRAINSKDNGWIYGSQGWGNYVNGEKMEYDSED
ncbi:hypothetical protein LH22_20215 [Pantoea rwandensis]|uniref:Uncharacterized protein n=1 Tax=Pantoea rwandensis TaxID=1076550 RepID=A0ABM5RNN1_9GAMM|nr:hypothetical protein LH22_20215 [Pantoea rwandensis]